MVLGSEGSEGLVEVGFARWSQKLCTCAPAARDTAKRSSSCSRGSQYATSLHAPTPPSVRISYVTCTVPIKHNGMQLGLASRD